MIEERHFPVFDARPSEEFVAGWHEYITTTGYPERYDRVSTSRPFDMAGVVVMSGELRVPTVRREDQLLVPCPLCSPNSPKFKVGRMAWFPQEKTVLFIGHDCAKKHIGEDYVLAERRYQKEAKARRYQSEWKEYQYRYDDLMALAEGLSPIVQAVEFTRWHQLERDAGGFARFLHSELAAMNGSISVNVDTGLKDGQGRGIFEKSYIGEVRGYQILGNVHPVGELAKATATIADISRPLPVWDAQTGNEQAMEEILARGLNAMSMLKALRQLVEFGRSARAFWNSENIAVLHRWGATDQSPFASLEFRRVGNRVFLRSESFVGKHFANITIPDGLNVAIPPDGVLQPIIEPYIDSKKMAAVIYGEAK
jgi:hypothetical protein